MTLPTDTGRDPRGLPPRLRGDGQVSQRSVTRVAASLTDNSGGTASDTIPAQTGSYVEATQETTIASLAGKINEIITAQNAIITALEERGLLE